MPEPYNSGEIQFLPVSRSGKQRPEIGLLPSCVDAETEAATDLVRNLRGQIDETIQRADFRGRASWTGPPREMPGDRQVRRSAPRGVKRALHHDIRSQTPVEVGGRGGEGEVPLRLNNLLAVHDVGSTALQGHRQHVSQSRGDPVVLCAPRVVNEAGDGDRKQILRLENLPDPHAEERKRHRGGHPPRSPRLSHRRRRLSEQRAAELRIASLIAPSPELDGVLPHQPYRKGSLAQPDRYDLGSAGIVLPRDRLVELVLHPAGLVGAWRDDDQKKIHVPDRSRDLLREGVPTPHAPAIDPGFEAVALKVAHQPIDEFRILAVIADEDLRLGRRRLPISPRLRTILHREASAGCLLVYQKRKKVGNQVRISPTPIAIVATATSLRGVTGSRKKIQPESRAMKLPMPRFRVSIVPT